MNVHRPRAFVLEEHILLQEYLDAKARDAEAELRFDEAWRTFEELAERLEMTAPMR